MLVIEYLRYINNNNYILNEYNYNLKIYKIYYDKIKTYNIKIYDIYSLLNIENRNIVRNKKYNSNDDNLFLYNNEKTINDFELMTQEELLKEYIDIKKYIVNFLIIKYNDINNHLIKLKNILNKN
jgi:hypothetical protein